MGLLQKVGQGIGQGMVAIGTAAMEEKRQLRLTAAREQGAIASEARGEKRRMAAEGRADVRTVAAEGRADVRNIAAEERAVAHAEKLQTVRAAPKPVGVKSTSRIGEADSKEFLQTMSDGSVYILDATTGERTAFSDVKEAKAEVKKIEQAAIYAEDWLTTLIDEPWSGFDREFVEKRFGGSEEQAKDYIKKQILAGKSFIEVEKDLLNEAVESEAPASQVPVQVPVQAPGQISINGSPTSLEDFIQEKAKGDAAKEKMLLTQLKERAQFKVWHADIDSRLQSLQQ